MAETYRKISDYPSLPDIQDDDLVLIGSGTNTYTVRGAIFKSFVAAVSLQAAESAKAARSAAEEAAMAAASVDPNLFLSMIAAKGDNLEFDADEGKLYLTSGGERISDGITVITQGGGGGGGESNNAVLTMKNTTGWIYKSIAYGAECPISIEWSSLEDEMPTGSGVLRITVNGVLKQTGQIAQGAHTIDVGELLAVGPCTVKVNVTDTYGNSRSVNFNITTVSLVLESSFDASVPYTGAITYPYTPTGSATKKVYFKVDGKTVGTATVTASGRQQTFTIPAQSHGSHSLDVYFEAAVDGETVESNHLYYDLICIEDGNTTPIIASAFRQTEAEQYDTLNIPFSVYVPGSLTADVVLQANGNTVSEQTVDRTVQKWAYRPDDAGALALAIICGSVTKTFSLTVSQSTIQVEAETDSLELHLSSYGRSNNEANPGVWQSGSIAAGMTGFNFTSDGWQADEEGITALRVSGNARVNIPLNIFASDFRTTGKTIEVEFATRDILNYDAVILSCMSGDRGLQLTAQGATLKSEQSVVSAQYKENEHVRLAFVVQKRSEHRLILVYINGVLSRAVQYPADDDFSQSSPVGISIGSGECTIDLYNIRVYQNDLTRFQVLDNWIADTQVGLTRAQRYKRNQVFDDYGKIVIGQLPTDLPYLILESASLPQYKGNKMTVSGRYVDPVTPGRSFSFTGAEIDVQGTSSATYARKNYKIKFKGGFVRGGQTYPNYQLRDDSVPTSTFTFKADVASSEGANNVELVRLYNEACPYRTPPQEADSTVRQGIDGYPCVIFQDNGSETVFIGKYNFNNDKGTPEVFGFADGDESWEILNNTSNRVLWKDDDFTGDWTGDFEARYPDKSTNVTNLSALSSWLKSTDRSAVSTEEERNARLQKFKDELSQHMEVDSALFYYLFTELFLMVDSRAKNAFPSMLGGDKWCWLPYDMDTAIGTNNEGALVFGYALEDTDQVGGADVYNGQDSVMWANLRDAFADELRTMYQTLRSNGKLSYADTEARFEAHQSKWPEAIFNEDSYFKYLEPLFQDGSGAYLGMLQGSKAEQRKWWLYNRFRYVDSKYNAGDALTDVITLRGYAKSDITITPYADIYASVKYGSYLTQTRALRGSSYTLPCPLDNVNDTEIYIYSASQIKDVGDLSGLKVGYAEFSLATRLQSLKLGDSGESYSNPNLTELYLGNNGLLKTLDVRNCPNLTQAVDLSGCANVENVYFDGTAITGCALPNGGILKVLHLPATVTNLTIRNQTGITDFIMPGYGSITTLRLENVSQAVPAKAILDAVPENSRVRIIGFDWSFDTAADILSFYDRLDTMRGLDEAGNNVDQAQMSGTVRVENITGAQLSEMQRRYPTINVVYQHITSYLYFYDDTGSTLLQILEVADGGDGNYTGSTPTKASTAQYSYSFAGWSKTPGGSADSTALKAVTADRNVYAAFTATVRKYTVYWNNGSTTLETDTNVPYGTTPTYNGSTPVYNGSGDAADYAFNGWTPAVGPITGNTTYTAKFKYNGYVYAQLIERSVSEYTDSTVTSVGEYAFMDCASMTRADFTALASIGSYAFSGCVALDTLILRSSTMCTLAAANALENSKIAGGNGYIYVPSALVATYQADSVWSTYASQIRAIEDYTDITGGAS